MNTYAASAYPPNLVPSYMNPMVGSAGLARGYGMPPQYNQAPHSQYPLSTTFGYFSTPSLIHLQRYSTSSSAVQGAYSQQSQSQYPSSTYPMLPNWNKGAGMQNMPMGQMAQGQGSQATSPSISGLIQASKQSMLLIMFFIVCDSV